MHSSPHRNKLQKIQQGKPTKTKIIGSRFILIDSNIAYLNY